MKMNREIVEKIENGDGLTDAELKCAHDFYERLVADLELLKPKYYTAWRCAIDTYDTLHKFKISRHVDKTFYSRKKKD